MLFDKEQSPASTLANQQYPGADGRKDVLTGPSPIDNKESPFRFTAMNLRLLPYRR